MNALNERYSFETRILPDGRVLDVFPLTFGRARLSISENIEVEWSQDQW